MNRNGPNFTFAEALKLFFTLQGYNDMTYAELADKIQVSVPTVQNWFKGNRKPRNPEHIERIALWLNLTSRQTDLLMYLCNPTWIKYGTPVADLDALRLVSYRVEHVPESFTLTEPPPIKELENTWYQRFADTFIDNHNFWGTGYKDDGICRIDRTIADDRYTLTLSNRFYDTCFMGGDSACFAPPIYYFSVEAEWLEGINFEDGFGLIFEEASDESFNLFRIKPNKGAISVIGNHDLVPHWNVYVNSTKWPIPPGIVKLGILANNEQHWFFVNDTCVAAASVPRVPHTRLDVGIIGIGKSVVKCAFTKFMVYTPPLPDLEAEI